MKQTAPAQRMADFTKKKTELRPAGNFVCTGTGFLTSPLLDALFHCRTPEQRFPAIREIQPWFLDERGDNDWSGNPYFAPVRITRDKETLQHVRVKGLFPCGEGAGYAGGIVSAGIDGERCAEAAKAFFD